MLPRFHIGPTTPLHEGASLTLPEGASRHVQVLRMQPGDALHVFDGDGREWLATVAAMGRKSVTVSVASAVVNERALPAQVTLAVGMPTNDRMDALVEKATELGVHAIQPLMYERSVLRLEGERASKKVAHWQAVAVSACEQCGRARVPMIHDIRAFQGWLRDFTQQHPDETRHLGVLSLRDGIGLKRWLADIDAGAAGPGAGTPAFAFLSGPEGGLSPTEEQAALDAGWTPLSLGARVLRADTAPLAALSVIGAHHEP